MRSLTQPSVLAVFVTLLFNIFLRLSSNFRACREEQYNCSLSVFLYPLTSLPEEWINYKNIRYFFSVGCVIFFLLAVRKYLRHSGNLHGNSPGIICVKYLYPVCGIAIIMYWALQGLPQQILDAFPAWQQVFLPRLVYIILFISLIATVVRPLTIHLLPKQEKFAVQSDGTVIPQVYNKMKQSYKDGKEAEHPPIVFGLGTTYSSALINFVTIIYLLLILLLGDGPSPSLLAAFISMWGFLELYTASGTFTKLVFSGDETSGYSLTKACKVVNLWPPVVFMSVMFSTYFFATGHQATVPAIRWESAFTGFHGDFNNNIVPAILITLNTFAAEVFFSILCPLIVIWPLTDGLFLKTLAVKKDDQVPWKGDFSLLEDEDVFKQLMFSLFSSIFLFQGIKVLGAVCAAALHRRHLMVWKIFAPRFVFAAVSTFTIFACTMFTYLIVINIHSSLTKWVQQLEHKKKS